MKYFVDLNGKTTEVEVDGDSVAVEGRPVTSVAEDLSGVPITLVRVGTAVHRVVVRRGGSKGSLSISVDGWKFEGEAVDERTKAIRELTAATSKPSGPAPIVAPMPGLIVRVSVSPGDVVKAGQGVVAIEAMKMENELRAHADGIVKSVAVEPGRAVEKGTILIEFTPPVPLT